MTSLSQERATLKHKLTCLERQLRRTENELAKVTAETENRPVYDISSQSKVSRQHIFATAFQEQILTPKDPIAISGFTVHCWLYRDEMLTAFA